MSPQARTGPGGASELARTAGLCLTASLRLLRRLWGEARRDRALGLSTLARTESVYLNALPARVETGRYRDSSPSEPTDYARLEALARRLGLGTGDVFVDLGCGIGRAVCLMSHLGAGRCVGVEADEGLLERARANAAETERRTGRPVEIVHADAAELPASLLDEATVLYLFNPFGFRTLHDCVDRLRESLARRPRVVTVAYHAPVHRWYLDDRPWLAADERPGGPEGVAVWRSRAGYDYANGI